MKRQMMLKPHLSQHPSQKQIRFTRTINRLKTAVQGGANIIDRYDMILEGCGIKNRKHISIFLLLHTQL